MLAWFARGGHGGQKTSLMTVWYVVRLSFIGTWLCFVIFHHRDRFKCVYTSQHWTIYRPLTFCYHESIQGLVTLTNPCMYAELLAIASLTSARRADVTIDLETNKDLES